MPHEVFDCLPLLDGLGSKKRVEPISLSKTPFHNLHTKLSAAGPGDPGLQNEQRIFTIREIEKQSQFHSDFYGMISANTQSAFGQVHDDTVPH